MLIVEKLSQYGPAGPLSHRFCHLPQHQSLSLVLCHTGRFCLAFLQGCALLEGRSHQLLRRLCVSSLAQHHSMDAQAPSFCMA